MFYNIGFTVESILKDRAVSDVKIEMSDHGPQMILTFDKNLALVVSADRFSLESEDAELSDARCAGMFKIDWDDIKEHPVFSDTACTVISWQK